MFLFQKQAPCFISYSWKNSKQAVSKGTKTEESALGWGDPREIKRFLEEHDFPCWIDIEQAGKQGLYKDIAEGLKNAKVVVCCVSEEVLCLSLLTRSRVCLVIYFLLESLESMHFPVMLIK